MQLKKQAKSRVVHRRELKSAPYNPRQIDPYAMKKLKASLKRFGVLEAPVWNERTGNIVGGHQRLQALDDVQGGDDYTLEVLVVDVDDATEREMNVALNNPTMQGVYDIDLLDALVQDGLDFTHAGFDKVDMEFMYEQAGMPSEFLDATMTPAAMETVNNATSEIENILDTSDEVAKQEKEKLAGIKKRREEWSKQSDREDENSYYLTIVFDSDRSKQAFAKAIGADEYEPIADANRVLDWAGVSMEDILKQAGMT